MATDNARVWLVTGASSGFGRALVEDLIGRGERVVATARDVVTLNSLVTMAPGQVLAATLDLTCASDITGVVAAVQRRFGRLDVLINNAGYGFVGGVEEAAEDEVRAQFEVNFFGLAALTRAVLPLMRAQGSGRIVNISSISGLRADPGGGYYSATKWAVEGFSEALAGEVAPFGIGVLIVEPGPFRTDFASRSLVLPRTRLEAYQPVHEMLAAFVATSGTQVGDPVRAAALIVDTCLQDSPPLRLVLGGKTFHSAIQTLERRLADVRRSADLAGAADYPESAT